MKLKLFFAAAFFSIIALSNAVADQWPSRPITFIVPFAAGGGGDTTVRLFRDQLSNELKQPVVIRNLVGAGGIVGSIALKQSKNDGYTIGMSMTPTIGTGQIFNESLPYDYRNDFSYIAVIGEITRGVFVRADSPLKTIDDLIEVSKNRVDLNFGVAANTPDIVNAVMFTHNVNGKNQLINYSGNTNTMIVDLLGGRLDAAWQTLPAMNSCVQDKSCRLLAVAGDQKHPLYPSVPTFKEAGIASVNAPSYYGVIAPAGLSNHQLETFNRAINKVISSPEIANRLLEMGIIVTVKNLKETKDHHFSAVEISERAAPIVSQYQN